LLEATAALIAEHEAKAAEIRALRDWIERDQVDVFGVVSPDVAAVLNLLAYQAELAEKGE
jgi:hypothetical protein